MLCPYCKKLISEDDRFCQRCGREIFLLSKHYNNKRGEKGYHYPKVLEKYRVEHIDVTNSDEGEQGIRGYKTSSWERIKSWRDHGDKRFLWAILIIFFAVLIGVLVLGFIATMVWSVLDIASDELTPVMEGLGMVGDVNVSHASSVSVGVVDGFVQSIPWLIALGYVLALIFTLVFVFLVGYNPSPAYIAFFFSLMLLLILGCVVISNMYQDVYTGTDEVALRLQEQTIMSFLILHSPFIMALLAVIGGVIMFGMKNSGMGGGI